MSTDVAPHPEMKTSPVAPGLSKLYPDVPSTMVRYRAPARPGLWTYGVTQEFPDEAIRAAGTLEFIHEQMRLAHRDNAADGVIDLGAGLWCSLAVHLETDQASFRYVPFPDESPTRYAEVNVPREWCEPLSAVAAPKDTIVSVVRDHLRAEWYRRWPEPELPDDDPCQD
jgi:hypothetical protein